MVNEEKLQTTGKPLTPSLNEWMTRFECLNNVRVEALDDDGFIRSMFADDPGGQNNLNIAAMGEGISQLLPVVATTLKSASFGPVLIEQPEIHLHPKLQAELGDLFVKIANHDHRQIIIETHSEHLLLRIRRRIAEGKIDADKVAILYVEKVGGVSKVRKLDLRDNGQFKDWPEGFLNETLKEALALATAKRMKDAK